MAISLTTGSSNSGSNDWSDVWNNDNDLVTELDAIHDNYQTILNATSVLQQAVVAGTRFVGIQDGVSAANMTAQGGSVNGLFIYFDDADYTIASKTQKLRVRAQVCTNATAWSSVTATFGLYPVTFAGAADALTATLGTVVTGSTVAIANPSASTVNQGNSGVFAIPADGQYALGVVTSATLTAAASSFISAQLQTTHA